MKRKDFLKTAAAATAPALFVPSALANAPVGTDMPIQMPAAGDKTMVISTWNFGDTVTETAYKTLKDGGSLLDAIVKGINIVEADPKITSVGYGGFPDRDGNVTLDACIMDEHGNAGSVLFLEHIMHPITVARLVMEKTPHVILAGDGALQFALEQGMKKVDLLTPESKKAYEEWLKVSHYSPTTPSKDTHDTIGLLAMDANGNVAGG